MFKPQILLTALIVAAVTGCDIPYTGNKLHPTQKPVAALKPLIEAFCPQQGTVLDPFAGSGSGRATQER